MKKMMYWAATIFLFAIMPYSCQKEFDFPERDNPTPESAIKFGVTAGPDNHKSGMMQSSMKAVQLFGSGDTVKVVPGVYTIFFVDNPDPLWSYTWTICGTVYTGTEIGAKFPVVDTCSITISAVITATGVQATPPLTAVLFVTNNLLPAVEQIKSYTSVLNGDFSWTYTIVGSTHVLDTAAAGNYFSTGDHTSWANSYTAVYTPGTVTFEIKTYNNEFKFQYGKGTIYSDATGSQYHAQSTVDNTYQVVFDEGVLYAHGHAINTTAPGTTGDFGISAAVRTTAVSGNLTVFCNIKDFVPGLKTNPYFRYRASGTTTWTTVPLVYVNGNGWGSATMVIASLPSGPAPLEFQYGADGGTAVAPTSQFWNSTKGLFELSLIGM